MGGWAGNSLVFFPCWVKRKWNSPQISQIYNQLNFPRGNSSHQQNFRNIPTKLPTLQLALPSLILYSLSTVILQFLPLINKSGNSWPNLVFQNFIWFNLQISVSKNFWNSSILFSNSSGEHQFFSLTIFPTTETSLIPITTWSEYKKEFCQVRTQSTPSKVIHLTTLPLLYSP